MPEPRQRSKAIPILVAAVTCDAALTDAKSGKKTLVGIFDRISASGFPTVQDMALYLRVSDAPRTYDLEIKFVQAESDKVLLRVTAQVANDRKGSSSDFYLDFPRPVPFPEAGRYEFRIFANEVFLGAAVVDASLKSKGKKKK